MKFPRRKFLHLVASAVALQALPRFAWAQAYPTRPITIVVPFPAASPADVLARLMIERMRASLGQPIVVDNVSGAAGSLAPGRVARAAADGYTVIIGTVGTHVFNGAIYSLPYDVVNDFAPISVLPSNYQLLVANNAATDLKGLVTWIKANPDKVTAGMAGAGSPSHLTGLYFQNAIGARLQFVPYRGTPLAVQDVMAGQIDLVFDQASSSLPLVRSGRLKTYGVTAKSRLASAPEIPTLDEAGLPGFLASIWFGMWAPKNTPRPIVTALNAAVVDALADPVVRGRLGELGSEIPAREQQTPEALAVLQRAEIEKWWPIIRSANIKPE